MEILNEQESGIFDGIYPYKSMLIDSHEQWDHMMEKFKYLGLPELPNAQKPPFTPYLP